MRRTTFSIDLPCPSPGTRRALTVHRYGRRGAHPKAYFHAALHADEWPGLLVLHHLTRRLDEAADAGRILGEIVLVPVANPVGIAQVLNERVLGRFAFGDGGGNYNRNWPVLTGTVATAVRGRLGTDAAANIATVREALLAAAAALPRESEVQSLKAELLALSIDADYVFDLHCEGEGLLHIYSAVEHRDTAAELAAELGAPVTLLEADPGGDAFDQATASPWFELPGLLDTTAPLPPSCFATTIELRGAADISDRLAAADAENIFRFLVRRKVVAGNPGPLPAPQGEPTPLDACDVMYAPAAGIVSYRKNLGDSVEAGETVADLIDLLAGEPDRARTPIVSRASGILFTRRAERLARPGMSLCKVAGRVPLAHRKPGHLLDV